MAGPFRIIDLCLAVPMSNSNALSQETNQFQRLENALKFILTFPGHNLYSCKSVEAQLFSIKLEGLIEELYANHFSHIPGSNEALRTLLDVIFYDNYGKTKCIYDSSKEIEGQWAQLPIGMRTADRWDMDNEDRQHFTWLMLDLQKIRIQAPKLYKRCKEADGKRKALDSQGIPNYILTKYTADWSTVTDVELHHFDDRHLIDQGTRIYIQEQIEAWLLYMRAQDPRTRRALYIDKGFLRNYIRKDKWKGEMVDYICQGLPRKGLWTLPSEAPQSSPASPVSAGSVEVQETSSPDTITPMDGIISDGVPELKEKYLEIHELKSGSDTETDEAAAAYFDGQGLMPKSKLRNKRRKRAISTKAPEQKNSGEAKIAAEKPKVAKGKAIAGKDKANVRANSAKADIFKGNAGTGKAKATPKKANPGTSIVDVTPQRRATEFPIMEAESSRCGHVVSQAIHDQFRDGGLIYIGGRYVRF